MRVLIPAYEPAEHLPALVAALRAADPELSVLIVDDGSGTEYGQIFERAASAGAEVLRHGRNRGKGAALRTGLAHAQKAHPGEGVVAADADGQHTVADILAVVARTRALGESTGGTMVLGCRAFEGSVPRRSRLGNAVARRLFRIAAGWSLSDTQTGLRGIPAAMIPWLVAMPGDRFEYEQRVLLGLRSAGYAAEEMPIETVYLAGNASSHFRPVADSVRVMLPALVFTASSLIGFLIDAVVLFAMVAWTGSLVPSIVTARIVSASANFVVNRRVVFLHRGRAGLLRQAGRYVLLAAVLLASNIAWMAALTGVGTPVWAAKSATEIMLFILSYRTQRNGVFATPSGTGLGAEEYHERSTSPTAPADTSTRIAATHAES
ncbi:bifunctional glycosyltransferase family 2/GtrA family protein [Leucobacter sp. USHLN153]|uniref:bifunctional glycosyltransferase family 2/GtrA family protein n=1 Tax=Leucobacter sp. USHLN153 TaxID=3081268 RepID=UPI003018D590